MRADNQAPPPLLSPPLLLDARLEAQRAYWREHLSGGVKAARLPAQGAAEESGDRPPEHLELDLEDGLRAGLEALSGGSLFLCYAALLSGLAACFYRYGDRGRVAVGSPVLPEDPAHDAANAVTVVVDVDGESTFRQLLLAVRADLLASYERQGYPLDHLVRDLGLAGRAPGCPPFSVVVALAGLHGEAPQVGQEVTLTFLRTGHGLRCRAQYRPERLRRNDLARFALHLQEVLGQGLRDSRRPVRDLALLTPAERQLLVVERNDTAAEAPGRSCLHELFEAQVVRTPEAVALSFRGEETTYHSLNARSNRWAHRLRALGVGPEVRVGLLLERSPHLVVALFAVLKAGGAYLPVDPGQPRGRLRFLLLDGEVGLILTESRFRDRVPGSMLALLLDRGDPELGEDNPRGRATADDLAYVLYTSGSTGRPKGVMVPHRGVVNYLAWCTEAYRVADGEGCPVHSPIGFDLTVTSLFAPLVTGRRVDLLPESRPVEELCAALSGRGGYSLVKLTPAHLEALAHWLPASTVARATRTFVIGGEELRREHLGFFQRHAPCIRLVNEYGPTEAVVGCCFYEVPSGAAARGAVPIGRPIAGVRLLVLDGDLEPLPTGVPGELFVGGAGLARGYLGLPHRTAERIVPDPFSDLPGARLYRTGDLACHREDGNLDFLGRNDHQVKVRGYRVELGEIEAALCRHPKVQGAVVLLREDVPGRKLLVAYVVAEGPSPATPAELRAFLGERLPEYMVPQAFFALAALPLTSNGKIDRGALPALAGPTGPSPGREAMKSPVEELLAGIWREVLGREIRLDANFFELGGHSLLATRVAARVRDALGVEVAPSALFETPTLAGFAARTAAALTSGTGQEERATAIERVASREAPVLSFAQEHLWFLDHLKPGTAAFNIPAGLRVKGRLDLSALDRSLGEIVRRHEALRTLIPTRAGQPAPRVEPPRPWSVPIVDLIELPGERREQVAAMLGSEEAGRPFDLSRGPLLRVKLLRLDAEEHLLLIVVHHIVSDGWSMAVLIGELADLYRGFSRGELVPLPELPLQYADYAAWQRARLTEEVLGRSIVYWQGRLAGAPQGGSFPGDRPRPNVRSVHGSLHPVAFPLTLSAALREVAGREGATLFMVLLAGFVALLAATGQDDVVVGTDLANRGRTETEGLIGLFVNQLPLRIDAGGNPAFRELLARVRQVALEAYLHQEVPFGKLVESLRLARQPRLAPLFQVKLIVQNFSLPDLEVPDLRLDPVSLDSRTSQLDLVLACWETPAGLRGWINYNTDLFETATIVRLFERYLRLLASAAAEPDGMASHLRGLLERSLRESTAMSDVGRSKSSFSRFKTIKPKAVSLGAEELIAKSELVPGQALPLVLHPLVAGLDLPDWVREHRAELERELSEHGALLFRGFNIDSSALFERFAGAMSNDLFNENGEHPREVVSGNVYTPVFYPPDKHLLWHNENSFNMSWPRKIMFCCLTPAAEGGETPIVDSRQVFARLPPEVREAFVRKGIMYQRNFGEGLGLPWQTVFQVATRAEVEAKCLHDRIELDWREGGRLRTRAIRPAVIPHPETGEMTWFNQAQHWHVSCLDPETRDAMAALFDEGDLPRHCYYGDGSPIGAEVMQQILEVYRELEVCFPWQRGDVLVLDNLLTAHARNPFKGKRQILVALGDIESYGATEPAASAT